jgi:hypothetical protein
MGHREVWPELESPAKVFNRVPMLSKSHQCRTQVAERFRIIGLDHQCGAATGGSMLEVTQRAINLGQIGMATGVIRPQSDCSANVLFGTRMVALLMKKHSKKVKGIDVVWFLEQHAFVQLSRHPQLPRLVLLDRSLQFILHAPRLLIAEAHVLLLNRRRFHGWSRDRPNQIGLLSGRTNIIVKIADTLL